MVSPVGKRSMQFQKISYAHTRSIKEMHSNERGRECPHTLVYQKLKRLLNAVDVVEHLLVPTDRVPNVRHLRVLHMFNAMTYLGGAGVTVLGSVGPGRRTTTSSTLRQRFRFGLRGYIDTLSPLVAMHHHDLAYA